MDKESRNAFTVIGAVLVALLAIGLIFSGRPGDAIIGDAPVAHGEGEAGVEEAAGEPAREEAAQAPPTAGEEGVPAEISEIAPGPEESQAGEPTAEAVTEPESEGVVAETEQEAPDEAAAEDGSVQAGAEVASAEGEQVALAGDPEAGESVFRQCQACHLIGEGAENRVGPHLTGVVGRPVASVEGFTYSDTLTALGDEGQDWTPDELRGFLANPREYAPGTAMAYAGVRSEDDLENLIAYLASAE